MSKQILTQEHLRSMFDYNEHTGLFVRRKATPIRGHKVGDVMPNGYLRIGVDRQRYLAHRLAWFYVFGVWPENEIDHIDGNKLNNRIANLRDATPSMNQHNKRLMANNTSGIQGVSWDAHNGKWAATIQAFKRKYFLGRFNTLTEARQVREAAKRELHFTATL